MSELNGVQRVGGRIIIDMTPAPHNQYAIQVSFEHVEGGWVTVYSAMLGGLGMVANQLFPAQQPGTTPLFRAMTGTLQEFMGMLLATQQERPLIERAIELPRNYPFQDGR